MTFLSAAAAASFVKWTSSIQPLALAQKLELRSGTICVSKAISGARRINNDIILQSHTPSVSVMALHSRAVHGNVFNNKMSLRFNHVEKFENNCRHFSTVPPPAAPISPPPAAESGTSGAANTSFEPPESLSPEAGMAAQDAMKLFIQHGVGKKKLQEIAKMKENGEHSLIDRWQKMIQVYLETQCHIIALLGYPTNEKGITLYTQHLSQALSTSSPEIQEQLRKAGRDTYRMVLQTAFDVPLLEEQKSKGELSIVDARNIMHKVSLKMQEPETLEKIAKLCSVSVAVGDSPEAQNIDLARKHTVVQGVMVSDVYLGGEPSLVKECGFGDGEVGYVRMQSAMAEHQGDPLITQYVGTAMIKLLESAGIDMHGFRG